MLELILGGARSGKSRFAERLAAESGLAVTYIATSQALDGEMTERIAHHRERRPVQWSLVEEPQQLARVLREQAAPQRCLLVDCLTLWLTNLLMLEDAARSRRRAMRCSSVCLSYRGGSSWSATRRASAWCRWAS